MGRLYPISCSHPAGILCVYHHKFWAALIKRGGEWVSGEKHDKSAWKDKLTQMRFIKFLTEESTVPEWGLSYRSHALLLIDMDLQNFLGKIQRSREHEPNPFRCCRGGKWRCSKEDRRFPYKKNKQQKTPNNPKPEKHHLTDFRICIFTFFTVCLKY